MLNVHRSKKPPFAPAGPLAGLRIATGDEKDLPGWAARAKKALRITFTEEVARLVFGKVPDGRWACVEKEGDEYIWVVQDPSVPLAVRSRQEASHLSAQVFIRHPTAHARARIREILQVDFDHDWFASEFERGEKLIQEIRVEGEGSGT